MYQLACDLSDGLVPCYCPGSSSLGCPKYFHLEHMLDSSCGIIDDGLDGGGHDNEW